MFFFPGQTLALRWIGSILKWFALSLSLLTRLSRVSGLGIAVAAGFLCFLVLTLLLFSVATVKLTTCLLLVLSIWCKVQL